MKVIFNAGCMKFAMHGVESLEDMPHVHIHAHVVNEHQEMRRVGNLTDEPILCRIPNKEVGPYIPESARNPCVYGLLNRKIGRRK